MTETTITSSAQSFLFPTTSDSTIREGIITALHPFADDYDLDAVEDEFTDAIQAALPEGFLLNGEFIHGPADVEADWDEVREVVEEIDFFGIAERHEIETVRIVIDPSYDLSAAGYLPDLHTVSDDDYEAAVTARDNAIAEFRDACEAVRDDVARELGIKIEIVFASYGSPEAYAAAPDKNDEAAQRVWQAVQDAAAAHINLVRQS